MDKLLSSAIHRPIAVGAAGLVVLALGIGSLVQLPLSLQPDTDYPSLIISAEWPGASSEAVVKHVTAPIESELATVPGILKVRSVTREGNARIQVGCDPAAPVAATRALVVDRLAILRPDLPPRVRPRVSEAPPEIFRDLDGFMSYRLSGPVTDHALRRLALEDVRPLLLAVDGVSDIEVIGGREEELHLLLDASRMDNAGLSPTDLHRALHLGVESHAAGALRQQGATVPLWTEPLADGMHNLALLPVIANRDRVLRLGDLAEIRRSLSTPHGVARVNGLPAITIEIARQPGTNMLEVADRVKKQMEDLRDLFPSGVVLTLIVDRSDDVRLALQDLAMRVSIALIAIVLLLLLFLRQFRTVVILLSTIALSALGAMICFKALGLGLDLLTISGLALAFGILVDNAVVVYENIRRRREEGEDRDRATVRGTTEMLIPVAATTLTTVVALVPIIYLSDELRQHIGPFALGLGLTLLASVIVAGVWVPVLGRLLDRGAAPLAEARKLTRIGWSYEGVVTRMIRWRWPIVAVTLTGFGLSVYLFVTDVWKGPSFSWRGTYTYIDVTIYGPPGMETATVDSVAAAFERYALAAGGNGVQVTTTIQKTQARVHTLFMDEIARSTLPYAMEAEMENMATRFGGLDIAVFGYGQGFSTGGGGAVSINYRLRGYNFDDLRNQAERLARRLERHRRVRNVEITHSPRGGFGSGGPHYELQLKPSQQNLARAGMGLDDLSAAMFPYTDRHRPDGEIQIEGRRVPYRTTIASKELNTGFDRIPLDGADRRINAGDAGVLSFKRVSTDILRSEQQYERWISYEFVGTIRMADSYRRSFLASVDLPPGYRIDVPNWSDFDQSDRGEMNFALGLAVALVLLITSALFESFRRALVVLLTVPMGLTGIFLVFWYFDLSFDRGAYLGTVFMIGIVVNNAILLVDRMARLQRAGNAIDEAISAACRQRLRPILITSLTTLVGLTPLLIAGHPSTRDLWTSLSYTGLSGLTVSTMLVLFVTPALYRLIAPGDLPRR